jgi:hypothetical protein
VSWDNLQWIFQKHWKCPLWVAWERDHKVFYEIKVHVVSLFLSLVFKTIFGIFLSILLLLKFVNKKCLEAFKSVLKEYSDPMLWIIFLKFKNIFTDLRKTRGDKNIPKTVLKIRINTKETTCMWFRQIPCGLFHKPLKEDIISETWSTGKNLKRDSTQRTKIKQESLIFFNTQKFVHFICWLVLYMLGL